MLEALRLNVTDLHLKSMNEPVIFMRLKNQIQPFKKMNIEKYQRMMTFLQYKAQLDFNRLSQPQTGSFQMELEGEVFYFRLSYLPSNNDIHLVLRFLNQRNKVQFLNLTRKEDLLKTFRSLLRKEHGLIIVCGPTGSGKSTTLHCFIEEISKFNQKNIVTIEDPIEIYLPNIIQIQVNESNGLTFETILNQVLRHDPDVIMIGELRNEYSAQIALKLSLTGHLVLTTLHASDGKTAIKRLMNLNLDKDDLQQILLAIITQRLFYKEEAFVLFETILKDDINKLIHNQKAKYTPLKQVIEDAYQNGELNLEDYEKYT